MTKSLPLTKELLLGLINVLLADRRTGGSRPTVGDGLNWLNPQPIPPRELPNIDPARSIQGVLQAISLASFAIAEGEERGGTKRGQELLAAFVDDLCGKSAPMMLLPPPWPRFDLKPNALDLVVASAQFHSAATSLRDHPLQASLSKCADRLLEAALAKLLPSAT